mmetsp:Transcript_20620/g.33679  ORF Transcript_20620/g.33679 Transcript_20620/m.33679 type:complete len:94 (-) Transcript_20620:924-1205(-)
MPYCQPLLETKVKKFVDVSKTEEDLKVVTATQPVLVAATARPLDWQFYSKGIFDKGCDAQADRGASLRLLAMQYLYVGFGQNDPSTDPDATFN